MAWVEGRRSCPDGREEAVRVRVKEDRIAEIRPYRGGGDLPALCPGFVDIHVHGGGRADTMDATEEAFAAICRTHARFGTTSLLLTTVTDAPERIEAVLAEARRFAAKRPEGGARVAGVHLEGPFLNPEKAGAQRRDRMIAPDGELAARWFAAGVVKMITLAPELPGAHAVAALAKARGVVAAAGHTQATERDMAAAAAAGFSHITHLCNAMRPLLHREVGPIGHAVADAAFTGDMICDGVHLDPPMVRTLARAIGSERLCLITDAIRAAAVGPGAYDLGGLAVEVKDGACRLPDGTLAGSVLTMNRAWRLVQQFAGVARRDAEAMASANPASVLGLAGTGVLAEGAAADLVALDAGGDVLWTMVGGCTVYERGREGA